MKFQIGFNRTFKEVPYEKEKEILTALGVEFTMDVDRYDSIEIKNFEKIGWIEKKLHEMTGVYWTLIITMDLPTIYIDKDI